MKKNTLRFEKTKTNKKTKNASLADKTCINRRLTILKSIFVNLENILEVDLVVSCEITSLFLCLMWLFHLKVYAPSAPGIFENISRVIFIIQLNLNDISATYFRTVGLFNDVTVRKGYSLFERLWSLDRIKLLLKYYFLYLVYTC